MFQFDPKDGVVTRLLRAGLTNNPNLHLTAIAASRTAASASKDQRMEFPIDELRDLLGLDAAATAEDVVARVRELRAAGNSAASVDRAHSHDPAHYVAIAEFERTLTELNALKADRARDRAAHAVEDAIRAGKIVARAARMGHRLLRRRPARLPGFRGQAAVDRRRESRALPRRASADRRAGALSAAELAICAQLGLKHSEFVHRKRGRADFLSLERADADLRNAAARSADLRNNQD